MQHTGSDALVHYCISLQLVHLSYCTDPLQLQDMCQPVIPITCPGFPYVHAERPAEAAHHQAQPAALPHPG